MNRRAFFAALAAAPLACLLGPAATMPIVSAHGIICPPGWTMRAIGAATPVERLPRKVLEIAGKWNVVAYDGDRIYRLFSQV